jgi:hypothetical protein
MIYLILLLLFWNQEYTFYSVFYSLFRIQPILSSTLSSPSYLEYNRYILLLPLQNSASTLFYCLILPRWYPVDTLFYSLFYHIFKIQQILFSTLYSTPSSESIKYLLLLSLILHLQIKISQNIVSPCNLVASPNLPFHKICCLYMIQHSSELLI